MGCGEVSERMNHHMPHHKTKDAYLKRRLPEECEGVQMLPLLHTLHTSLKTTGVRAQHTGFRATGHHNALHA